MEVCWGILRGCHDNVKEENYKHTVSKWTTQQLVPPTCTLMKKIHLKIRESNHWLTTITLEMRPSIKDKNKGKRSSKKRREKHTADCNSMSLDRDLIATRRTSELLKALVKRNNKESSLEFVFCNLDFFLCILV